MNSIWNPVLDILEAIWPLLAFMVLFSLFKSTWMFWRQEIFKKDQKWVFLEIKIPREITRSPLAMEQVLTTLHQQRNAPNDLREWYWDGEVTRWLCLELVSFGGETHFYIRCPVKRRGLVEAAFFAYYPDLEIVDADDYVDKLPISVRETENQGYDMWGTEIILYKPEMYPIRSYKDFESPDEEKQFDPMSGFMEVLGKLKKEEIVCIQYLLAPADYQWHKKWDKLLEKLKEPRVKKEEAPAAGGDQFVKAFSKFIARSPGETDVLEQVEKNLSKPAFDTTIRFLYFSPKAIFYDSYARRGLAGAFNQYAAQDLNSFGHNYPVATRTKFWQFPYFFPDRRRIYRQQRLLSMYRNRKNPWKGFFHKLLTFHIFSGYFKSKRITLNAESLASIYHPPTASVLTAPHIKRVESRKAGPPAGMAIYGDEKNLEKYM